MRYRRIKDDDWSTRGQLMRDAVEDGRPFRVGAKNLTGRRVTSADADYLGDLPEPHRTRTQEGLVSESVNFAIYSYVTPIAVRMINDEWIMPDVNYSLTTSQHQDAVRWALSPKLDGPHISMRKGFGPNGRYGCRRGGIDGYCEPLVLPEYSDVDDELEPTVIPELAHAFDAMNSAEAELKRWAFDAIGLPIID